MSQDTFTLTQHQLVAIGRPALMSLRTAILGDGTADAATALRSAGYAGGDDLWSAFTGWTEAHDGRAPEALDLAAFQSAASAFFHEIGWGTVEISTMRDSVVAIASGDWWEAEPDRGMAEPGCHFTTGLLAHFFGQVADAPLAVLEVECRSTGAPRCRFLLGAPEVLRYVFDELERGENWEEAVNRVE